MAFKFDRLTPTALLRLVGEAVLLFLVVWAPWPFASRHYVWEAVLVGGTALLVLLWCTHAYFTTELKIRPDAVCYCLAGLAVISFLQLVPLPESVVGILSPSRLQLHRDMIPAAIESLAGEIGEARTTWIPLTFDPFFTRAFLCQMVGLLLLYLVVRSWLASRESLRRIAWVLTFNGMMLAIVGLAQFFSSTPPRNVVFWSYETTGAVFGPFICKNHYPDYVLFCIGLGVGLIASRQAPKNVKVKGVVYKLGTLSKLTDSPDLFTIGSGLILAILSIPFTLSRGGLLATGLAVAAVVVLVYRTRGTLTRGLALGGGLVFLAILVGSWFGWSAVSQRVETLWSGKAGDTRKELWSDVARLIPNYIALGSGNGAFQRIEPLTRTDSGGEFYLMENAHNEYLEAILEGGLPRFLLTLALCYFALRYTVAAYVRLRDRSSGPLILGIFFGLVGLVAHSFVDFGIHMPAVAFLAAVLVAYAADAATDPTYVPFKKKSNETPPPDPGVYRLRGGALIAFAAVAVPLCIWLMVEAANRGQGDELKYQARDAVRAQSRDQHKIRLEALTAAVVATPTDADAWTQLAQAHFESAEDERRIAAMALGSPPAVLVLPPDLFVAPQGEHVRAGLAAARQARNLSPLLPRPHIFLGLYAGGFAKGDPAKQYFARAVRTCPSDPAIWIHKGTEAAARRDINAAVEDWQRALSLDPNTLPAVLTAARRHLDPEQFLSKLLPSEPIALSLAVDILHPGWHVEQQPLRVPYLERIAACSGRGDWTARGWFAIAQANVELARSDAAFAAWKQAITKEPENAFYRDHFSRWLMKDERYADAEEQLLWLRNYRNNKDDEQRLEEARHALDLKKILEGP